MNLSDAQKLIDGHNGVLFGSRAWSCFGKSSDYDYVMPFSTAELLKKWLISEAVSVTNHEYYVSGYYFIVSDGDTVVTINVTGCKAIDYQAWVAASEMMKVATERCQHMKSKEKRQALFEAILAILKPREKDTQDIGMPF